MSYFVVIRERGPAWDPSRPMRDQQRWDEHASFMDGLVDAGFVVLGGPLGDSVETLLVIDADGEEEIETRLAADPWTPMELLRVARVEPWEVLLGEPSAGRGSP